MISLQIGGDQEGQKGIISWQLTEGGMEHFQPESIP